MPAPRRPAAGRQPADPPEETTATAEESPEKGSSQASSAAGDFFEHEGPEFEGGAPVDEDRAAFTVKPGDEELLEVAWDPKVVRSLLETTGETLHTAAGKAESDWVFVKRELDAISAPLARILSRYPVTAAASGIGDEFAVIIGLSGYTMRSLKERKAAIEALEAGQPVPGTPEPAAPPVDEHTFDAMAEAA